MMKKENQACKANEKKTTTPLEAAWNRLHPEFRKALETPSNILFFKGCGNYILAQLSDGTRIRKKSRMKDLILFLDPEMFFIGPKSYIINVENASGYRIRGRKLRVGFENTIEKAYVPEPFKKAFRTMFSRLHD
jgi:hypothetical protein